jgi:inhibitor of cysteine peptidase
MLRILLTLMLLLIFLTGLGLAQNDKAKPKLLDGELIEEGQTAPVPAPAQPAPENNTRQEVAVLKEFSVTLPSNPSTGYGWKVARYDRDFLQLLRRRYQKPEKALPGAPGQEIFEFLPQKSGTTTVIFHYQRPFESQVARELKHTVVIK